MYAKAVEALRGRLDPDSKSLAAHHITQNEGEQVSDYIRRMEQTFKVA